MKLETGHPGHLPHLQTTFNAFYKTFEFCLPMARGRYPTFFADDYAQKIVATGKCDIFNVGTYLPMFAARQVPSEGNRISIWSWKNMRPMELLSGVEEDALRIYDSHNGIESICEQVALDPSLTRKIVREMPGVRHPKVEDQDVIMSTDFVLLKRSAGVATFHARSVKRACDITKRVEEKLEIERRYWAQRGIEFRLVLDTKFPPIEQANLTYIAPRKGEDQLPCSKSDAEAIFTFLNPYVIEGTLPLAAICRICDQGLQMERGTALAVSLHLIARRRWPVAMSEPIAPHLPLPLNKHHAQSLAQ